MTAERTITTHVQFRRRTIDLLADIWKYTSPEQMDLICRMLEITAVRVWNGANLPATDGNVVALPGVDLEAARRAQKRARRAVRP
jgi:hypothetical protein